MKFLIVIVQMSDLFLVFSENNSNIRVCIIIFRSVSV